MMMVIIVVVVITVYSAVLALANFRHSPYNRGVEMMVRDGDDEHASTGI